LRAAENIKAQSLEKDYGLVDFGLFEAEKREILRG
jgi:hypothetical protein